MLRYNHPQIVLQEVPDEISLALSISGCNLKCKGCHSSDTWNPKSGKLLTFLELETLIIKNKYISCILFYGGEWELDYLSSLFIIIKKYNLKIALYTGQELSFFNSKFLELLDYIKTGPYIYELGGLDSPKTNQKFFIKSDNIFKLKTFYNKEL